MNQILDELVNTAPQQVINENNLSASTVNKHTIERKLDPTRTYFNIDDFLMDVNEVSLDKNKKYLSNATNINGYDIASNCIRQIIFKLLKQPVTSYVDNWLPVIMRANLGNAIHDFIQNTSKTFTEWECSLKVPSQRVSVRLDNLIRDNVLVEIKSCTFTDYDKIIRTNKPRDNDFYQAMFYRYLLHEYLDEIKSQPLNTLRSPPPKLPKYNIDTIQLIYAAHDLISSESGSLSEALKHAAAVKKVLNSKYNRFYYITTITLDLNSFDTTPYENYIKEKLQTINYHIDCNKIPSMDNKFIKPSGCFFCLYKNICKTT